MQQFNSRHLQSSLKISIKHRIGTGFAGAFFFKWHTMLYYICIYIHIKCPQVLCLKDSIFSEKNRLTD